METSKLILVFIEGLLSFLSPCIVPLLPVYISILSNSTTVVLKEERRSFIRTQLFKNTILFIMGISSTFFILGASINALSDVFISNKEDIIRIGGVLVILMGLFYMGYLNIPMLQSEKRFAIKTENMKPITAYILGLTFSFGWTPCVGPMLASVIIMASSSENSLSGNLMIFVYTLGFTVPFIVLGAFYTTMTKYLNIVKLHMNELKKIGGLILIISGIIMVLGGADKVRGYIYNMTTDITKIEESNSKDLDNKDQRAVVENNLPNNQQDKESVQNEDYNDNGEVGKDPLLAPDFTLKDQYGKIHTLSEYKGKIVFLNFWATWCPPCREEMPNIEEIYKKNNSNENELVILGVAMPNIGREGSVNNIKAFLKDKEYTFPVVFDEDGKLMNDYFINAFPTTYIIGKDGRIVNFIPGAMDKEVMEAIIKEAMGSK
ncbi:cytochrome c-type biogenesis protein [Clostridium punense]|uniref:Cytochrome c-type biogenesis protein n=1 Tax=Clostridium punense TaxID=1054297 RepID=A0ABS4K797_9CLOT|nr:MULTISPECIES: cytochrome c biogenesis protein/redoxin [Clostridium]EQB88613.1 hypothetical protein M918_24050 [Clostridium sp. BL8]MBP2023662.1 cytochrome c-type biogenesis protein [Clostridium punense]